MLGDVSAKPTRCPVPRRCSVNTGRTKTKKKRKKKSIVNERIHERACGLYLDSRPWFNPFALQVRLGSRAQRACAAPPGGRAQGSPGAAAALLFEARRPRRVTFGRGGAFAGRGIWGAGLSGSSGGAAAPRAVAPRMPRRSPGVPLPASAAAPGSVPGLLPVLRAAPAFSAAAMSKEPRAGREEILECQVMWEPDSKKNTQMDRFRAAVGAACGLALGECGVSVPGGSPATSWLDQGLSEIGLLPWPSEGHYSWSPGSPFFLDVGVRAHLSCWNGLLIFIFPPLGVGGATGQGGARPRGWDIF